MAETVIAQPAPVKTSRLPFNFKWKNSYWWWVGGAAVGSYLIAHFVSQGRLLYNTCFKPAGFMPNKLTLNEADINIKMKMLNKSDIDYYIKSQGYNVYINNSFVGVIKNPNKIYIAPKRYTDLWLNVKFSPLKVSNISWDTLKDLIIKGGDLKIQLQGVAKIKAGVFSFNYPVDETFALKELLQPSAEPC